MKNTKIIILALLSTLLFTSCSTKNPTSEQTVSANNTTVSPKQTTEKNSIPAGKISATVSESGKLVVNTIKNKLYNHLPFKHALQIFDLATDKNLNSPIMLTLPTEKLVDIKIDSAGNTFIVTTKAIFELLNNALQFKFESGNQITAFTLYQNYFYLSDILGKLFRLNQNFRILNDRENLGFITALQVAQNNLYYQNASNSTLNEISLDLNKKTNFIQPGLKLSPFTKLTENLFGITSQNPAEIILIRANRLEETQRYPFYDSPWTIMYKPEKTEIMVSETHFAKLHLLTINTGTPKPVKTYSLINNPDYAVYSPYNNSVYVTSPTERVIQQIKLDR